MLKTVQFLGSSSSGFVSHRLKQSHGGNPLSFISLSPKSSPSSSPSIKLVSRTCKGFSSRKFRVSSTHSDGNLPSSSSSSSSTSHFSSSPASFRPTVVLPDTVDCLLKKDDIGHGLDSLGNSLRQLITEDGNGTIGKYASGSTRKINFCQSCGGPTKQEIPDGEEKMRCICTLCGKIAYENPKMVVGCLIEHDNKILLCKRNIQPSYGLWTLPAGYMEMGESATEGAIRETWEEAGAEVEVLSSFAQLDIPLIGQTYIIFLAKLKKPHFSPGPESSEVRLFAFEDIPFDSLAFSSMLVTLDLYIQDIKAGKPKFHYGIINKRPGTSPSEIRAYTLDHHMQT